jgi:hypothetical protein
LQAKKLLAVVPPGFFQHHRQAMDYNIEETAHRQAKQADIANEKGMVLSLQ